MKVINDKVVQQKEADFIQDEVKDLSKAVKTLIPTIVPDEPLLKKVHFLRP